jgi:hypothetical protein
VTFLADPSRTGRDRDGTAEIVPNRGLPGISLTSRGRTSDGHPGREERLGTQRNEGAAVESTI